MFATEFLVHTKHIAYFATANSDVASGNVLIGTYVAPQFKHETLAEAHDFGFAATARCKVGTTLGSAHRQCGQGVLEGLLKAEELQDAEIDGGMETHAALVRANGVVELHAIAEVDVYLSVIVGPGHAEGDDAVGLH